MNTTEREITKLEEIKAVLESARVCRIALFDGDFPYIIPMFFGYSVEDGCLELFFRCDEKGKKFELLKANNNAAFEIENIVRFIPGSSPADFTAAYQCLTGVGTMEIVTGIDKITGLSLIMKKYVPAENGRANISEQTLNSLAVLKLTASRISCLENSGYEDGGN